MRHRIVRAVAWLGDLCSRPVTTVNHSCPASGNRRTTSPPSRPSRPPRLLDVPIDGDASRLVRPYLVVAERRAREQAARLFAYQGGVSVYVS